MATKKSSNSKSKSPIAAAGPTAAPPQPPQERDFLDADRREVIHIASCESLDWLTILQTLSQSATLDPLTLARRLPGILARLAELSSIVLSAIDDPSHETAALHQSLSRGGA